MLSKPSYVAEYEGRSINSQVLILIRQSIKSLEDENGPIICGITPSTNVKPAGK